MKNYTLEVCADSVESVLAAESGGATRIELCQNLVIGGTTPDASLFKEIRTGSCDRYAAPGRTSGSGKNGWSERGSRGYVRDTAQSL